MDPLVATKVFGGFFDRAMIVCLTGELKVCCRFLWFWVWRMGVQMGMEMEMKIEIEMEIEMEMICKFCRFHNSILECNYA